MLESPPSFLTTVIRNFHRLWSQTVAYHLFVGASPSLILCMRMSFPGVGCPSTLLLGFWLLPLGFRRGRRDRESERASKLLLRRGEKIQTICIPGHLSRPIRAGNRFARERFSLRLGMFPSSPSPKQRSWSPFPSSRQDCPWLCPRETGWLQFTLRLTHSLESEALK